MLDQCPDDNGVNVLGVDQTLQQIHYNRSAEELLILGANLLSFDPLTSGCRVVIPFLANRGIIHLNVTPQNQILGLALGGLVQLDRDTAEVAIISR